MAPSAIDFDQSPPCLFRAHMSRKPPCYGLMEVVWTFSLFPFVRTKKKKRRRKWENFEHWFAFMMNRYFVKYSLRKMKEKKQHNGDKKNVLQLSQLWHYLDLLVLLLLLLPIVFFSSKFGTHMLVDALVPNFLGEKFFDILQWFCCPQIYLYTYTILNINTNSELRTSKDEYHACICCSIITLSTPRRSLVILW